MNNINVTKNNKELENTIKSAGESTNDIISINLNKFLTDVGISKEAYFELVPSMKFILENYSVDNIKPENKKTFLMKNGTALNL